MRRAVLFLALASAAAPALAADSSERETRREAVRAERAERAEARSERQSESRSQAPRPAPERAAMVERRPADVEPRQSPERGFAPRPEIEPRQSTERRLAPRPEIEAAVPRSHRRALQDRSPHSAEVDSGRPQADQRRDAIEQQIERRRGPRIVEVAPDAPTDSVRVWRRSGREQSRANRPVVIEQRSADGWQPLRERRRETMGRDSIGNRRAPIVSRVPREGTQPPPPAAARPASLSASHWRGDWRRDRRYDWNNHRKRNRWLFHLGFYSDPFGWGYRPFSIGWRMWPNYYRSSYWLNDPWMYRLPPAYPPYRWIRYYDDALLVDTWSGEVVDVIHEFFW